jgi:serine/threonine protein kinase
MGQSQRSSSSGTLAYMGPERFGRDPLPIKASDIWALGATLFELLEGDIPFGEHGGVLLKSGAEIPDMHGPWSEDLKLLITLCLSLNTWDRPTAEQIVEWATTRKVKIASHEPPAPEVEEEEKIEPEPEEEKIEEIAEEKSVVAQEATYEAPQTLIKDKPKSRTLPLVLGVVVLAVLIFLGISYVNKTGIFSGGQSAEEAFTQLLQSGDTLYGQGEVSYKQALEAYRKAKIIATDNNLTHTGELDEKMSALTLEIDALFNNYASDAEQLLGLYRDLDAPNMLSQAIALLEKALALKDDASMQNELNNLKNK